MEKLLIWLSGKKSIIATIIITINGYLYAKAYYGDAEFALISTLIGVIFGYAGYETKKVFAKAK